MEASLLFLGSGGGPLITSRQILGTGGIVLSLEGHQIHIDPGPGTLMRARQFGIDVERTSIILASSESLEKTNDIPILVEAMTGGGIRKRGIFLGHPKLAEGVSGKALAEVHVLEQDKHMDIDGIRFVGIPTKSAKNNIGFKIISSKFIIGYTSDTEYFPELAKHFENTDILILNTAAPSKFRLEGHLNSDDVIKLLDKVKPRLAVLTGFWPEMLEANPMYEAREIQRQTNVQVIAANDGLKIDPTSYAAASGQRTLSGF